MVYPPDSFNVQTWWVTLKRSVCVKEKAQGLFVISHPMKTAGSHQCNSRLFRFVCWGGIVRAKCWRTVFKSETDRAAMSKCAWYCDRMRVRCCEACWLRWRNAASHFGASWCFCPFSDTHTILSGRIGYRWLRHSADSPNYHTKRPLIDSLDTNRSNQPGVLKTQSPNCSTFKEINPG